MTRSPQSNNRLYQKWKVKMTQSPKPLY